MVAVPRLRGSWAFPQAAVSLRWQAASSLFSLTGMSSLASSSGIHVMTFQTADTAHGWLNEVVAIGEGSIDPNRGLLAMRYYACVADYLPGIETRPVSDVEPESQQMRIFAGGWLDGQDSDGCCGRPLAAHSAARCPPGRQIVLRTSSRSS